MTPKNDNDSGNAEMADPVLYLNKHFDQFGCLPSTFRGRDIIELADELRDLPGLNPEVNKLLKACL